MSDRIAFTSIEGGEDPLLVAVNKFFKRRFYYIGGMAQLPFRSNAEAMAAVEEIQRLAGIPIQEKTDAKPATSNAVR